MAPVTLTSEVMKELQRAAALMLLERVFDKKGMTEKQQQELMYDSYHGKADDINDIGYLEQMTSGLNQFAGLYNKEDLEINEASNADRREAVRLVLKSYLHRENSKTYVVGQSNLTKKTLGQSTLKKNAPLINGRTLMTQAKNAWKNGKRALAIANALFQPLGPPNFTSISCCLSWRNGRRPRQVPIVYHQPGTTVTNGNNSIPSTIPFKQLKLNISKISTFLNATSKVIKKNKSLVIPSCWVASGSTEDSATMIHSHVVRTGSVRHLESLVLVVKTSRALLKHHMSCIS